MPHRTQGAAEPVLRNGPNLHHKTITHGRFATLELLSVRVSVGARHPHGILTFTELVEELCLPLGRGETAGRQQPLAQLLRSTGVRVSTRTPVVFFGPWRHLFAAAGRLKLALRFTKATSGARPIEVRSSGS